MFKFILLPIVLLVQVIPLSAKQIDRAAEAKMVIDKQKADALIEKNRDISKGQGFKVCTLCHNMKNKKLWVDMGTEKAPRMSNIITSYKNKYGKEAETKLFEYISNPDKSEKIVTHYYKNYYEPMPTMKRFLTEEETKVISHDLILRY